MNQTAIIFATRKGGTRRIVQKLKDAIDTENVDLIDLKENTDPDLAPYQAVILGGPVYAGKLFPPVYDFAVAHEQSLMNKKLGLFLCGMNEPEFDAQMERSFSENLRNRAVSRQILGGEFDFSKLNWIERFLIKRITGIKKTTQKYRQDCIDKLVDAFKVNDTMEKSVVNES
ncbi:flavodoxin domain-containing protein [Pararhodonellum marinum]|uniref:flavodoxin domain-containing protein n=1 Tax=Pararhodonellum marinum TaxID=2755358 RepID=UPI00188F9CBA|nr:flavodoxin domain-containing protein [Pararhodonellum marinum]